MIAPFASHKPRLHSSVFVAPDCWVIGDVEVGEECSIFFGAVLRGDLEPIRIGVRTNIQEHAMIHTSRGRSPAVVGDNCTIGHRAIVHGAEIGSNSLIGMGAIILDDVVIEEQCLIGAGALVTERKRIPARSLVLGSPAKVIRTLSEQECQGILDNATSYVTKSRSYLTDREFRAAVLEQKNF